MIYILDDIDKRLYAGCNHHANGVIEYCENAPPINQYSKYIPFRAIKSNEKIWNCLNFKKFASIIKKNKLYFARLDQFKDDFEALSSNGCRNSIDLMYKSGDDEKKKEHHKFFEKRLILNRTGIFVNCWHVNEKVDPKMLSYYDKRYDNKVIIIESDTTTLMNSLQKDPHCIEVGMIQYFDDDMYNQGLYAKPFYYKRKYWKYESELRCIISNFSVQERFSTNVSLLIDVDPFDLIHKIHIRSTDSQFINNVQSFCKKWNLENKIIIHALN